MKLSQEHRFDPVSVHTPTTKPMTEKLTSAPTTQRCTRSAERQTTISSTALSRNAAASSPPIATGCG